MASVLRAPVAGEPVVIGHELAIHTARQEAVNEGITPASTEAVRPDGYPVMWGVTWRTRSASWILRHRELLSSAISQ